MWFLQHFQGYHAVLAWNSKLQVLQFGKKEA